MREDVARQSQPEPNGEASSPVGGAGAWRDVAAAVELLQQEALAPIMATDSTVVRLLKALIAKLEPEARCIELVSRELDQAAGMLVISVRGCPDPLDDVLVLELR